MHDEGLNMINYNGPKLIGLNSNSKQEPRKQLELKRTARKPKCARDGQQTTRNNHSMAISST